VIRFETADALTSLSGFRNLLVHEYMKVDHERVHAYLNTKMDGLLRFAHDVAKYLGQPAANGTSQAEN
jgi:uncharacterized protein YutE (UPF0331/DUF86 family)